MLKGSDVARYIDYTLLRQDVISAQIDVFCDEAVNHALCKSGLGKSLF